MTVTTPLHPSHVALEPLQTQYLVERFLFQEARLLDERRFEEWLQLFTEDTHYWMPVRKIRKSSGRAERWEIDKEIGAPSDIALFDDDYNFLALRIARLRTGKAWAEEPPSATRHVVTNVIVDPGEKPDELSVHSSYVVLQTRAHHPDARFSGSRQDTLRQTPDGLRIAKRKIVPDSSIVTSGNMSFFL